jgi:transcriptional regulator with XRE-family HTH domain
MGSKKKLAMQFIDIIREKAGLSRKEFAERLGITRQSLEHYIHNHREVTVGKLMKMKEMPGLSGNDFFTLLDNEKWVERKKPKRKKA